MRAKRIGLKGRHKRTTDGTAGSNDQRFVVGLKQQGHRQAYSNKTG
jgi:hypothetical protein